MKAFCTHALDGLDLRVCCWIDPTFVSDGQKKLPQRFVHVFSHFHPFVFVILGSNTPYIFVDAPIVVDASFDLRDNDKDKLSSSIF